jgi:hypothetical protein
VIYLGVDYCAIRNLRVGSVIELSYCLGLGGDVFYYSCRYYLVMVQVFELLLSSTRSQLV